MQPTTSKRYAVVDAESVVREIVEISADDDITVLRPGITPHPIPEPGMGSPRVFPGMLFAAGKFWNPVAVSGETTVVSAGQWRNLFTFDEHVKIDNFADDTALTVEQRGVMTTFAKNLTTLLNTDLADPNTALVVNLYATVGYIDQTRVSQVLSGHPVA